MEVFYGIRFKGCLLLPPLGCRESKLFASEWENPDSGRKTQLTLTVSLQVFKNSPTIFGNQIAKELDEWDPLSSNGTLLQYIDDLLIATENEE